MPCARAERVFNASLALAGNPGNVDWFIIHRSHTVVAMNQLLVNHQLHHQVTIHSHQFTPHKYHQRMAVSGSKQLILGIGHSAGLQDAG